MEIKLADVLKRELKQRGDSLNKVSKETNISSSTLSDWYHGRSPSARNLHLIQNLSSYLGLPLEKLLFDKSESIVSSKTLFSSEFVDGECRYRLIIEKIHE